MARHLRAICAYARLYTLANTSIATSFQHAMHDSEVENWPISDDVWGAARLTLFYETLARANLILVVADSALLDTKAWNEIAELLSMQTHIDPAFRTIVFNLELAPTERLRLATISAEWRPLQRLRNPMLSATQLAEIDAWFQQLRRNLPEPISPLIVPHKKRPKKEHELVMAQTQLIVVRAIQLGWPLEELLEQHGISLSFQSCRWSSDMLRLILAGDIDLAIYNREASLEFQKTEFDRLEIIGNVGASMRGRHLYLLSRNKALFGCSEAEITRQLRGKSLAVPLTTDIFDNIMMLLGITREWFSDNNVRLVDISADANIDELRRGTADFVTGGQNIRFEAISSGDYTEVFNSMTAMRLPATLLKEKSVNCVVGNRQVLMGIGHGVVTSAINAAWRTFAQRMKNPRFFEEICEKLFDDSDRAVSIDTIRKIVRMSYA